jgi:microcystin-dependent protein
MPSQYQRPQIPYAAQGLENNNRYALTAQANQPVSAEQLDGDANYVIDSMNLLYAAIALIDAGFLTGAGTPANVNKIPVTDGANNMSWVKITAAYFAAQCIPTAALQDGCVTNAILGNGSVSNDKIEEGAVDDGSITDNAISFDKITNESSGHFEDFFNSQDDGTLSGTKISAGSLPANTIAAGSLPGTVITDGTLPAASLVANSLTRTQLAPVIQMPIGMMTDWAGAAAPSGFLLADGIATHLIATYPALYAVLGTTYGGDGITTFGVPDTRGRALFGINPALASPTGDRITGVTFVNGTTGGAQTHTLDITEIPPHTHEYDKTTDDGVGASGGIVRPINHTADNTSSVGGGASHNNMPPYMLMPKIIYAGV